MKTDLTINATSATDGKKVTNKITYVNPEITDSQAIQLTQAINALTTNSYTSTTRTDTRDCNAPKTTPSLNLAQVKFGSKTPVDMTIDDGIYKCTTPAAQAAATVSIKVGGDIESTIIPTMEVKTSNTEFTGGNITLNWNNTWEMLKAYTTTPTAGEVYTWVVTFPETTTYHGATFNFQCTITE